METYATLAGTQLRNRENPLLDYYQNVKFLFYLDEINVIVSSRYNKQADSADNGIMKTCEIYTYFLNKKDMYSIGSSRRSHDRLGFPSCLRHTTRRHTVPPAYLLHLAAPREQSHSRAAWWPGLEERRAAASHLSIFSMLRWALPFGAPTPHFV